MHLLGEDDVDVDVVQRLGAGWGGANNVFLVACFSLQKFLSDWQCQRHS